MRRLVRWMAGLASIAALAKLLPPSREEHAGAAGDRHRARSRGGAPPQARRGPLGRTCGRRRRAGCPRRADAPTLRRPRTPESPTSRPLDRGAARGDPRARPGGDRRDEGDGRVSERRADDPGARRGRPRPERDRRLAARGRAPERSDACRRPRRRPRSTTRGSPCSRRPSGDGRPSPACSSRGSSSRRARPRPRSPTSTPSRSPA